MIYTINQKNSSIEIAKETSNFTNEELKSLKEISDKFPTYTIIINNKGGGNGNCGCGGKCSSSKLHSLLNKEIFNLKSRVLNLEVSKLPTYAPYQQQSPYITWDITSNPLSCYTTTSIKTTTSNSGDSGDNDNKLSVTPTNYYTRDHFSKLNTNK